MSADSSERPRLTGLAVVAIYVDDLEPALAFYEGQLGFVVEDDMPPGKLLRLGDLQVYVEPGRAPRAFGEAAELGRSEVAMALLCDGVLAFRARLEAQGARLIGNAFGDQEAFAMFRVADPAGNVVEIAGRP